MTRGKGELARANVWLALDNARLARIPGLLARRAFAFTLESRRRALPTARVTRARRVIFPPKEEHGRTKSGGRRSHARARAGFEEVFSRQLAAGFTES